MPYQQWHVEPTGRRMTRHLAAAIDNVTGVERLAAIQALSEMGTSPTLTVLWRALALELRFAQLRADQNVDKLEDLLRDDRELEDPPTGQLGIPGHVPEPPPLTGGSTVIDPGDL